MEFEVKRAHEIPEGQKRYPFDTMDVGDFFVIPAPRDYRAASAAIAFCKRLFAKTGEKRKFRSKTEGSVTRCYRIA